MSNARGTSEMGHDGVTWSCSHMVRGWEWGLRIPGMDSGNPRQVKVSIDCRSISNVSFVAWGSTNDLGEGQGGLCCSSSLLPKATPWDASSVLRTTAVLSIFSASRRTVSRVATLKRARHLLHPVGVPSNPSNQHPHPVPTWLST